MSGEVDFEDGVSVSHLLLGRYYFGFQVSGDDSPSGKQRVAINQPHSGRVSQRKVCRLNNSNRKPVVSVQQDEVLCPETQSCAGFLDGVVALSKETRGFRHVGEGEGSTLDSTLKTTLLG